MIELEVTAKNHETKHERSNNRKTYRNCNRERMLSTDVSEHMLHIPKLRSGESYYPSILEHRFLIPIFE